MKITLATLLPVCILTIVCTVTLLFVHELTKERISENIRIEKLKMLNTVMTSDFDNNIYQDIKTIHYINNQKEEVSTDVYRARRSDSPVGVIFIPFSTTGYNGKIDLAIGILYDGTLSGVQVLTHHETENLGADVHHEKSDWLKIFSRQSLDITPLEKWKIRADGGNFDQLSGATITSRSVINAIRDSLELYAIERDNLFLD